MNSQRGGSAMQLGVAAGVGAYTIWGLFPAFFPLLLPAGAVEILAHRMVWTLAIMLVVLAVARQFRHLRALNREQWLLLAAASFFISVNWGMYVFTVNSERVSEAALGYFINPLVSVVLGVVLFSERLRGPQKVAVGLAAVAVGVLTIGYGHVPYLSLILAFSFGMYGVMKKKVGSPSQARANAPGRRGRTTSREPVPATVGLTAEVLLSAPFALAFLVWLSARGEGTFLSEGPGHTALLVSAGLVTAVPLLLFAMAARRIPLGLVGMLQYITPSLQLMWAVVVVGEHLDVTQWIGFGLVLVAVLVFNGSQMRELRTPRPDGGAGK